MKILGLCVFHPSARFLHPPRYGPQKKLFYHPNNWLLYFEIQKFIKSFYLKKLKLFFHPDTKKYYFSTLIKNKVQIQGEKIMLFPPLICIYSKYGFDWSYHWIFRNTWSHCVYYFFVGLFFLLRPLAIIFEGDIDILAVPL